MSETETSGNLFRRWPWTLSQTNHPVYRERLRSFVANTHILLLVLVFLGITAAWSCVTATLDAHLFLTSAEVRAWPQLFLGYFVFFIGGDLSPYELSGWWGAIAYATQFGLRAFFLASIVFKLLLPKKIFRFRENVSIYWDTELNSWLLNVRLYNSSSLEVLNVKFSAYVRVPFKRDHEPVISNLKLKITKPQSPWWVSLPKVPYTIKITLHEDELKINPVEGRLDLESIQGISIKPNSSKEKFDDRGNTFLVVAATAEIPNLGKSFSETHWWPLTGAAAKLQYGAPKPVDVTPGKRARKTDDARLWPGWRDFEKVLNDEHKGYVFAYGSLVDQTEINKLHSAFTPMVSMRRELVRLKGYRRVWNVAMDNTESLPNYKRYKDRNTDEFPDIFVTFLNVEEDPTSSINGVLIPVTEKLRDHLDARERNYKEEPVCVPINKDDDLPVWVYMGSEEGKKRFCNGKSKETACISKEYELAVENAFDSWGALQEYRQTTERPQVPTRCLQRVPVDKEDRPLADENIREDQDAKLEQVLTAVKSIQTVQLYVLSRLTGD